MRDLALNSAIDALEGKDIKSSMQDNLERSKKKIVSALRKSNSRKRRTKEEIIRKNKRPKRYHLLN